MVSTPNRSFSGDRSTRRSLLRLGVVAVVGFVFAGCPTVAPTDYAYLNDEIRDEMSKVGLGPGDVFQVTVYNEEELSGTYRVSPEGSIHFPLINEVKVEGMTPNEIEARIRDRLQDGFIREPSVSIFVKEYNSKKVFVLGEVVRPGTFPFSAGMNIVEAVTLAGGFKDSASSNNVVVTRKTADGEQRIAVPVEKITEGLATNLALTPGDIIYVPDSLL